MGRERVTYFRPDAQPDCPPTNDDNEFYGVLLSDFTITKKPNTSTNSATTNKQTASTNADLTNSESTNSDSTNNDSTNADLTNSESTNSESTNSESTNSESPDSESTNSDSTNTATNVASTKKTTDAQAEVINCNDETTKAVQIKAGVTNPTNDFDAASGWTKDPDNSARWIKTYALADLGNPEFIKEGEEDWMVLTATEGTTGCEKIKVDGVDICKDIGESYSFKCKYNLKDQTIKDTFSVTGQDTEVDAEGIGELSYTIEVDENVEIGETVNFTIKPASPGLVFATATECHVKNENQEVTIFGHRTPKCYTSAVGAKWATTNANPSSKNNIKGEWTAFKWSTSTAKTDAESQTFECTIALSKEQDPKTTTTCPSNK